MQKMTEEEWEAWEKEHEAERKVALERVLAGIHPETCEPLTPRDRAIWPEDEGVVLDDPIEIHMRLERPVYEWMVKFLHAEDGNSFFCTFEEAITTIIRCMAKDGIDWEYLEDFVVAAEVDKIKR